MLLGRWPGSLGDGYCAKYRDAARLGPIRNGSRAAMSAGVIPYHPFGTVWLLLNPRTVPPGQSAATVH